MPFIAVYKIIDFFYQLFQHPFRRSFYEQSDDAFNRVLIIINDVVILGNDSNLLIVFYVQIMPDDFVMQLHRF